MADIGLSSLEVMEFIEKIEDHFDITIPLNILPDVNTIGELAKKVRELNPEAAIRCGKIPTLRCNPALRTLQL